MTSAVHHKLAGLSSSQTPLPPPTTKLSNLKGAWGMMLRSPTYSGPAIRVRDQAGVGPDVNIDFDPRGYVTEAAPYADTRVITIYDQSGNGNNLTLESSGRPNPKYTLDSRWLCAQVHFRNGGVENRGFKHFAGSSSSAYNVASPIMCVMHESETHSTFRAVCGSHRSFTQYFQWFNYGYDIDANQSGLRTYIDGNSGADAAGTNTAGTDPLYAVVYKAASGTMRLYHQGTLRQTRSYSNPIDYPAASHFVLGITGDDNQGMPRWVETFVLDESDAPTTNVTTLTGYLNESRR